MTPPTVSVTAPTPSHGLNGYFNAQDLAAGGGVVTLNVSAKDNSGTGIHGIACTDNGSPIPVVNLSGTSTMTGTVSISTDGTHNVACTGTDNNTESSANTATVTIDTTPPVISLPSDPLSVQGSASGAMVFSYGAVASDPDSGDTPDLACQPAAPNNFPIGNTTVTCTATDRAGNTTTRAFTVSVSPPTPPTAAALAVTCSPTILTAQQQTTCSVTATSAAGAGGPPVGQVTLTSPAGYFANGGECQLTPAGSDRSTCSLQFTATAAGTATITAGITPGNATAMTTVASSPTAGQTAAVTVSGGTVLIKEGATFVPLPSSTVSVPSGSIIDALKGHVTITTAADGLPATSRSHKVQTATFSVGIFTILQHAARQHPRVRTPTDVLLDTPAHAAAHARCALGKRASKGIVRELHSVVKGLYRIHGNASTVTSEDGTFTVQDRCDGTITHLSEGHAQVTVTKGRLRGHIVQLHAGQSYLAVAIFAAQQTGKGKQPKIQLGGFDRF